MFQVNDVIIYGAQGVCKITGTEEKTVSGKKKTYFVLKPVCDKGSTIFAPTDNEFVLKKMRRLLTIDEIHQLIDSMRSENAVWVENENERKELYKSILTKGDHLDLIKMIRPSMPTKRSGKPKENACICPMNAFSRTQSRSCTTNSGMC